MLTALSSSRTLPGQEHEEGAFEQMVREKYDWDLIARQTEQVYREVAGG
ncbi:hypothetical protein [Oceanidesulfovibrio marinus]|nr:hypothetical protein [Oceanidesulfovibrio marinus]